MKIDLIVSKIVAWITICVLLFSCGSNDPVKEDIPELITKVTLTFTPASGAAIVVTATDPDGEGVQSISFDSPINLAVNKTYVMKISLVNGLAEPTSPDYDVAKEVAEEGEEHMFFFSWTGNLFSDPAGNGNITSRSNPLNYTGDANSVDRNNLPLGLTTTWTTSTTRGTGSFRIMLKHQPGLKSATSESNIGETDLDVVFEVRVE